MTKCIVPSLACQRPTTASRCEYNSRAALLLAQMAPDDDVDVARLVLERHEDYALGGLRLLAQGDDAAGPGRRAVLLLR